MNGFALNSYCSVIQIHGNTDTGQTDGKHTLPLGCEFVPQLPSDGEDK